MLGSRRRVAGLALLVLIFGLGVLVVAEAYGESDRALPAVAERYQPGPIAARVEARTANLPTGSQELFGLGVLVALLCGFRASGLARASTKGPPAS
jgi:hypothetical protein